MSDAIIIKEAAFECSIGITDQERSEKQKILIDIKLKCDIKKSARSEKLEDTINYSDVHEKIKNIVEEKPYSLLETLAETIATEILNNFNTHKVTLEIKKPQALADRNVSYASIKIKREK